MKVFFASYAVMAFGVFIGNWLVVPSLPATHRSYQDGFYIGLIAFGLVISIPLLALGVSGVIKSFH